MLSIVFFRLVKTPGKNTHISGSDRFPLKPTGEIRHILMQMDVLCNLLIACHLLFGGCVSNPILQKANAPWTKPFCRLPSASRAFRHCRQAFSAFLLLFYGGCPLYLLYKEVDTLGSPTFLWMRAVFLFRGNNRGPLHVFHASATCSKQAPLQTNMMLSPRKQSRPWKLIPR